MALPVPTRVFVPNTGRGSSGLGTVVSCSRKPGQKVVVDDPLFEIQFDEVDAAVLAPVDGTLIDVYVGVGDKVAPGRLLAEISTDEDGETLGADSPATAHILARAPLLAAVAVSAMALVWPLFWLAFVLVGSLILVGAERTRVHGRAMELADAFVVPARAIAASAGWLKGRLSQPAPLSGTLRFIWLLVAATVGTAAVGGIRWLVIGGGEGFLAAMRLATFGHALQVFAFAASVSVVRRGLSMPARRVRLERALSGIPSSGLTAAALFPVGLVALCAFALPQSTWWPAADLRDAESALPAGLRDTTRGWQRSLAETEARSVVECAAEHSMGGWLPPTSLLIPDGTVAVSVNANHASPPNNRSLAVLMLALQNQLAPTVSVVVIHTSKPKARIRYELIKTATPITNLSSLADNVASSPHSEAHLNAVRSMPAAEVNIALRCSAVAF